MVQGTRIQIVEVQVDGRPQEGQSPRLFLCHFPSGRFPEILVWLIQNVKANGYF